MARKHTPSIGTVSHGTLRDADLIDAFEYELQRVRGAIPRAIAANLRDWRARISTDCGLGDPEFAGALVNALCDALDALAPAYCYFGAHPGDGSDFGFWPCDDAAQMIRDDDGLIVSDTSEIPRGFSGIVAQVSDHGNIEVYRATRGRLRSLWSCV